LIIRQARASDRDPILKFCTNTFTWGDYIDQVWDFWLKDRHGRLLVAEAGGKKRIGMAHVALCPDGERIWLEGIRVHPDYRRSQVASALIDSMTEFGHLNAASQASAIVALDNLASQRMMEKSGFAVISRWAYYGTDEMRKMPGSRARFATASDSRSIWNYLLSSRIYRLSAGMHVKSWHWYPLDHNALKDLVRKRRVIVAGEPVKGIAIINPSGYWKRKGVLQVVYLDSYSTGILRCLVSFVANIYAGGSFQRFQVLCQQSNNMMSVLEEFRMQESEQFLLYNKVFTPRAPP
jgi:ribosomal protein S18 acetylase RimI-like enzyme